MFSEKNLQTHKLISPLVSVIVPSYNHEKYITECIESIVNQTYSNFEIIVIDDGSMDNSVNILNNLQSKYKFKLLLQENQGISRTLNRGIFESSNAKFITFCSSDDYWIPQKLEKQVLFMERNKFYPMCYGKMYRVTEESEIISVSNKTQNMYKGGFIFDDIFQFKFHPPVTYLFRKEIFEELGDYKEKVIAEDFYMNLKIAVKYPIGFIDEYLAYYRQTNMSAKILQFEKISTSHLFTIEDYKWHTSYKKSKRIVILRKFENFAPHIRYKGKAFIYLIKSLPFLYYKRFWIAFAKFFLFLK
jgi:alpha-1,3-rhamnosyltransferase